MNVPCITDTCMYKVLIEGVGVLPVPLEHPAPSYFPPHYFLISNLFGSVNELSCIILDQRTITDRVHVSCSSGTWRKSLSCKHTREARLSSFIHGSDVPCLLAWDSYMLFPLLAAAAELLNTSSKRASFLIRLCNSSNRTVPAAQVR